MAARAGRQPRLMMSIICEAIAERQAASIVTSRHIYSFTAGGRKVMALPRRIFIALGDPSDVSPVAAHDVRVQDLQAAVRLREEAEERVRALTVILTKHEKRNQNETILGGLLLFVLISSFLLAVWLCLHWRPPEPPPSEEKPVALPVPLPIPVPQPHHDCRRGCGPPHYWEYENFECWRHRSMRGSCFN
jgi:hypothetical protein